MQHFIRHLLFIFAAAVLGLSALPARALTCATTTSTISETVDIGNIIKVSSSELIAGQKIWVSPTISARFTCSDTDKHPKGESAYFWLDPGNKAGTLPAFIKIGITYNGADYLLQNGQKVEIGPATICRGDCTQTAIPVTFDLNYQVYIIATGSAITNSGVIAKDLKLSLFQVDGEGGLRNGRVGDNYNLLITGLNQINAMACVPTVAISPSEIDFGTLSTGNARPGQMERIRSFTVTYGLSQKGSGIACGTEDLFATFSSVNKIQDAAIVLPESDSGFGIILSKSTTMTPRIEMNAPEKIPIKVGVPLIQPYFAGVLWTTTAPKTGAFSATATITVTFQ